jgi:hypothetical protein
MAKRLQQSVKLRFDPAIGVGPLDHGRHHLVGVQLQSRVGNDLEQRADAEHIAPDRSGFLRCVLAVAEHFEPHDQGVE